MTSSLNLADFDFELPEGLIAQKPLTNRDQSRLMILDRKTGAITDELFSNLPKYIAPRSLVIFNDTKVVPSKLSGYFIKNGRPVEVLLVRETREKYWEALIRGLAKLKPGTEMEFGKGVLKATLEGRQDDKAIIKLAYEGELKIILNRIAKMPLPPYIERKARTENDLPDLDRKRYQTVFARHPGAIAAPTAGLHFTPHTMASLENNGIEVAYLTLHVGVGTFQPIRTENVIEHKMQAEQFHIPKSTVKSLKDAIKSTRDIIAVGSTATRVLEAVDLDTLELEEISGWTDRFIYPGQNFEMVNHMLTNFHLPKSTLYLLVCAFAGKNLIEEAYKRAIEQKYRFFSYGDAMLIL